jgi:hypothetical protein
MGDNCWKATLAAAESCLPPASETGTVGADGTCSYASGTVVTFQPPQGLGPYTSFTSFELKTGGSTCLSFANNDAGTGSSVTTQAGTVSVTGNPDGSARLVCPDGSVYTSQPLDAATWPPCPGDFPELSEGFAGKGSPDGGAWGGTATLSFEDTGIDGGMLVFACTK